MQAVLQRLGSEAPRLILARGFAGFPRMLGQSALQRTPTISVKTTALLHVAGVREAFRLALKAVCACKFFVWGSLCTPGWFREAAVF